MNLNQGHATRWGVNGLILLGLTLALYYGQAIFIPTIIAVLLAAMLWPAVQWLNQAGVPLPGLRAQPRFPWLLPCAWRLRVPWSISCAAAVGVLLVFALAATLAFGLAIPKLLQSLPNDERKSQEVLLAASATGWSASVPGR